MEVIDKRPYVGGASATISKKGCLADFGPHAMHIKDTRYGVIPFIRSFSGEKFVLKKRDIRMTIHNKILSHPLKIEEALFRLNPFLSAKILYDYGITALKNRISEIPEDSFKAWGIKRFGPTLYDLFFGSYTEKVWGVPAEKLSVKLAQQKVSNINVIEIILHILGISKKFQKKYFDKFGYYEDGIGKIYEMIADKIRSMGVEIHTGTEIKDIHVKDNSVKEITFDKGGVEKKISCKELLSTIPLKYLVSYISPKMDNEVISKASSLRYRNLVLCNFIIGQGSFTGSQWIYLLDKRFRFNRVSEQKNLSVKTAPEGKTVLSFEICCDYDDIWNSNEKELHDIAIKDLELLGVPRKKVDGFFSLRLEDAYPIYDLSFSENVASVKDSLEKIRNLYIFGRQSLFLNNDMHDSMEMGFMLAEALGKGINPEKWRDIMDSYTNNKLEGKEIKYV